MNPANPDDQSASKAAFSKMAVLTDSLTASGRERQSDHLNHLNSVQQIVQSCSDSLQSAATNWSINIAEVRAEVRRSRKWLWMALTGMVVTWVTGFVLMMALSSDLYPVLRLHALQGELRELQAQVEAAKSARQTARQEAEEIYTNLARMAPLKRWRLVPSEGAPSPFIRIDPTTIQQFDGSTIALPELKP